MIPMMGPLNAALLPAEVVVRDQGANYVIRLEDYNLSSAEWKVLMPLIGMRGQEAVGGKLYLTNFRLIFQAHAINRVLGTFSIFLPTIRRLDNASVLIFKRVRVTTTWQSFVFVIWGVPAIIAAIRHAQAALKQSQQDDLRHLVAANLDVCIEDPELRQAAELLKQDMKLDVGTLIHRDSLDSLSLYSLREMLQGAS